MSVPTKVRTPKDLTLRLMEIVNTQDWDSVPEIFDPDVVIEWPQSRERLRGRENVRQMFEHYPGGLTLTRKDLTKFVEGDEGNFLLTPMFTLVRSESMGDTATSSILTTYPDGSDWYIVNIITAKNGKIIHGTQFFAPVYEAPEWRRQWVEEMEPPER